MDWIRALPPRQRRGSRPRCLLLVDGDRATVARQLTALVGLDDVRIEATDSWRPRGLPVQQLDGTWDLAPAREAYIEDCEEDLLPTTQGDALANWWLDVKHFANTPNWDIASTCTIGGRKGLLLAEAKAHSNELSTAGKSKPSTTNGFLNHEQIGRAIQQANAGLSTSLPDWRLARDTHYQLCNRIAWAWKVSNLGVPVVLVYLGFLGAQEMSDQGSPFGSAEVWENAFRAYAAGVAPDEAWGKRVDCGGAPLWFLIRSTAVALGKTS
jgi:hypothetical protein